MDRREFFHNSIIATLAASVLGDSTLMRAQQAPAVRRGAGVPPPTPRPLVLDAYSRCLHWLRTPDEIAEAAIELTCGGVHADRAGVSRTRRSREGHARSCPPS